MDLQQLRYIVAVDAEKNFSRAADRVFISQPTLSQQIKKLEKELGVQLFERSTRYAKVTAVGEIFIPKVRHMLEMLEWAVQDVKDQSGRMAGKIKVGFIPTIGPYLIPKIIKPLKKQAPEVILEFHELTTSVLLEKLDQGKIDLGVLSLPIAQKGIRSENIGSEPFYVAVSKSHRFAKKRSVSIKDVVRESLLVLQEGHCFRDQSLEVCKLKENKAQVIFQGSSLESVLKMASAGQGITFVPDMAVDKKVYSNCRFLPFSGSQPKRDIGFVWRSTTPLSRAHRLFMKIVQSTLDL